MSHEENIIFIIFYSIAVILLIKYYQFTKKKKNMQQIIATCTNTVYKTGYNKNTYIYYYTFTYKNEEYTANDKTYIRLPINPHINDKVIIFINPNNPNDHISFLKIVIAKIYLLLSIALLILPFFF